MPTIFALASGRGRAGIAVIRISGPDVRLVLERMAGGRPMPRKASLRTLTRLGGEILDRALVLFFPAPGSYTGEDVAELHVHGGPAVLASVESALIGDHGLRRAEPGEFTKRAFLAGKLDLTEAEAIADLVEAETEAQRRQALRQMEGALGRLYESWRGRLLRILALAEAEIDFPDEGLPDALIRAAAPEIGALIAEMSAHLSDARRGERLRDGVSVVILGAPNVGKSSLLNRLARRDAAIVSTKAGTTRDVIEVHLDLNGIPVILADTAGLRETDDPLEREGVARAKARAAHADLRLFVLDAGNPESRLPADYDDPNTLVVINKIDQAVGAVPSGIAISAKTGAGIDRLLAGLSERAGELAGSQEAPVLTRARHREAVADALFSLSRALAVLGEADLAAEDLRLSARALGRITGRVEVEQILDIVFREFCIGK